MTAACCQARGAVRVKSTALTADCWAHRVFIDLVVVHAGERGLTTAGCASAAPGARCRVNALSAPQNRATVHRAVRSRRNAVVVRARTKNTYARARGNGVGAIIATTGLLARLAIGDCFALVGRRARARRVSQIGVLFVSWAAGRRASHARASGEVATPRAGCVVEALTT